MQAPTARRGTIRPSASVAKAHLLGRCFALPYRRRRGGRRAGRRLGLGAKKRGRGKS
jgi:hypothetical protein